MKSPLRPDDSPYYFPNMAAPFTSFVSSHLHAWCEGDLLASNALELRLWAVIHVSRRGWAFFPAFIQVLLSEEGKESTANDTKKRCSVGLAGSGRGRSTGWSPRPKVRREGRKVAEELWGRDSWEQAGKTGTDGKVPDKTIRKHAHQVYLQLADSARLSYFLELTDLPRRFGAGLYVFVSSTSARLLRTPSFSILWFATVTIPVILVISMMQAENKIQWAEETSLALLYEWWNWGQGKLDYEPSLLLWKWQQLKSVSLILGSFCWVTRGERLVPKLAGSVARLCGCESQLSHLPAECVGEVLKVCARSLLCRMGIKTVHTPYGCCEAWTCWRVRAHSCPLSAQ